MRIVLIASGIVVGLLLLGWLGLQIKPAPFPALTQQPELETIPLPEGLPAPVERFYRGLYGEDVPVISSAVISGRGTLTISGLRLPMRFRFTHQAGRGFRSDIDITFYGRPIMQALESYVDGRGYGSTPGGVTEGEAWFDQSANIRMWAEVIDFFPAALLTTPDVRWEPIDDHAASLVVPLGEGEDRLIVRFDPGDGAVQFIEAMKYKDAGNKKLWVNGIWMDDGVRWLEMDVEQIVYNLDVSQALGLGE